MTARQHEFAAPRWLKNPHLQTLGAAMPFFAPPRSHTMDPTEDLRVELGQGHRLHARAWWQPTRAPAVVVVHGIGGSSLSAYVVRAAVALRRRGYHVVRLDLRGAGASIPDVPSLYHAGLSADLGLVLESLARDPRVANVAVLGFSGGGSMALKLAGEWGERRPAAVSAIVSVSAPLDYTLVAPWMDAVARIPYRFHVLRGLSRGAKAFAAHHPERAHYRPEQVKRMSSFRHYDGNVICPMHGFDDVDVYYEAASAGPWLGRIATPTLLVHAEDDPMVPHFTVRPWLWRASSSVEVVTSPRGGHLGWVEGLAEDLWIDNYVMRTALPFLARATKLVEVAS